MGMMDSNICQIINVKCLDRILRLAWVGKVNSSDEKISLEEMIQRVRATNKEEYKNGC
jgi:hypothetical protein